MSPRESARSGPKARSKPAHAALVVRRKTVADWLDLQRRVHDLLIGEDAEGFVASFEALHRELRDQAVHHTDSTLTTLLYLGSTEIDLYSATHSVLVSVLCGVTAREILQWTQREVDAVEKAALSMNIEMTALQDVLARQSVRPSPEQQRLIDLHSVLSADLLNEFGIRDELWLEAVRHHHDKEPGPLAGRAPHSRLARLIERSDVYAARLAPRAGRAPLTPEIAMQSCILDENRQADEAGTALIRAVGGTYPPGSAVVLANGETGIVAGRSRSGTSPRVAVLVGADGKTLAKPLLRSTGLRQYRVTESKPHRDLGSTTDLAKIIKLL